MPSEIESIAYVDRLIKFESGVPWHSCGVPVTDESEVFDIPTFMKKANLDWTVSKVPLVTLSQAQSAINYAHILGKTNSPDECPVLEADTDHYATVRDTDKSILGVVGPQYNVLNNIDAFGFFKPWLDEKIVALNTAGSLMMGKKVWVLCQVMANTTREVVKGDNVGRFLLLSNSHNATSAVRASFVSVRCVCGNTIRLAENTASSRIRIRHSSKVKENLEYVREIVNLQEREFQASVEQYQYLASRQISKSDLRKYVRILVQDEKLAETQKWEDVPTRTQNQIRDIEKLMDDPRQKLAAGSYWAAYNAFNTFLNYNQGRTVDLRLNNLWMGQNEKLDQKAFELALSLSA